MTSRANDIRDDFREKLIAYGVSEPVGQEDYMQDDLDTLITDLLWLVEYYFDLSEREFGTLKVYRSW